VNYITEKIDLASWCCVSVIRAAGCIQRVWHGSRWIHHRRRSVQSSRVDGLSSVAFFHRRHLPTSRPWR